MESPTSVNQHREKSLERSLVECNIRQDNEEHRSPSPNGNCTLLVFVGLEMSRHSLKTDSILITGIIGIRALVTSMTLAFITGMIIAYLLVWIGKKRVEKSSNEI